ncbi:serine/arginine repetitive matrix protein 1-like [Elysia marginata]|uniref:Serine/arginine repetitive matrix protein 1-like n=1 Tax=Elysia marginata TaxID=1093978 RepID=A0AAV4IWW9_9GAST|nr:serine/arginine repetitive matrix protein 1-like [Elysia marginata]
MLSTSVSWLANGYKPKLNKEETETTENRESSSAKSKTADSSERPYPQPLLTSGQSLVRKSWSARRRLPTSGVGGANSQTRPSGPRARSAPSGMTRSRLRPGSAVSRTSTGFEAHTMQPDCTAAVSNGDLDIPNAAHLGTSFTMGADSQNQNQQLEHSTSEQNSTVQNTIDLYTQPLANRNIKNAAFRLYIYHTPSNKDGTTPSDVLSPASRPSSGRMRVARSNARPLGKPRSAWEAENEVDDELWYPLNIASNGAHPSPAESETNLEDLNIPPFHTSADTDKMIQQNPKRPFSSFSDRPCQGREIPKHGQDTVKRPVSSCDARFRRWDRDISGGQTVRPRSRSSCGAGWQARTNINRSPLSPSCHYSPVPIPAPGTPTHYSSRWDVHDDRWDDGYVEDGDDDLRASSPWLEDPRIGLSVGFEPDPRLLYFDQRHARCLSHSGHSHVASMSSSTHHHTHHPLIMWQVPAAGDIGDTRSVSGAASSSASRPLSKHARRPWSSSSAMTRSRPASGRGAGGRFYSCKQRYVDVHRPKTAPSTRKELQNYGASAQRGYLPHYCNFVRSVNLHARPTTTSTTNNNNNIIVTVDDNTDDGYITNTDVSHTEAEQEKSRPVKSAPVPLTGPSLTTRAESPSSTGYDPESLLERLQEQGLAGSINNLDTTGNASDVGDEADLDEDFRVEEESENGNSREVTTQTPVQGVRVVVSPAPGPRLPIQIPTPDVKQKEGDLDLTDSARSKEDVNPTRAVDKLTSTKNKEPARKPLAPSSGSKGKGRTPCVKKEKTFSKEKKKKSKKKEDIDKRPDSDDQKTQVQKQKDEAIPEAETIPAEPITVEAKAPDLPSLDVPDASTGTAKGKRKKSNKKLITASKPVEKPKSNLVKEEPVNSFYDFGDIETTKAELEDAAALSRATKVPSYLNDRMVLSLQSSRFELPMDMKSLEKMSPAEYLRKYCVISSRRKTLYQKIFQKHRERGGHIHGKTTLSKALQEVLVNALKDHHLAELCDILEIEDHTLVDLQLFSGTAALAERILYPDYLTEDTAECTEYHRERVECADFCALQWKLHGVQVSPPVKKILQALG